MAFIDHKHPHHILHPLHGWLTPEFVEGHSVNCACGHDLPELVGKQLGKGGNYASTCQCNPPCPSNSAHPEKGYPHHVETDISTGMTGYTRLSLEEIAVRGWCELIRSIAVSLGAPNPSALTPTSMR